MEGLVELNKQFEEFRVNSLRQAEHRARHFEEQRLHSQNMEKQMLEMKEILISMAAHQVFDETPKSANTIEIDDTELMDQEKPNRSEPIVVKEPPHQVAHQVLDEMSEPKESSDSTAHQVLDKMPEPKEFHKLEFSDELRTLPTPWVVWLEEEVDEKERNLMLSSFTEPQKSGIHLKLNMSEGIFLGDPREDRLKFAAFGSLHTDENLGDTPMYAHWVASLTLAAEFWRTQMYGFIFDPGGHILGNLIAKSTCVKYWNGVRGTPLGNWSTHANLLSPVTSIKMAKHLVGASSLKFVEEEIAYVYDSPSLKVIRLSYKMSFSVTHLIQELISVRVVTVAAAHGLHEGKVLILVFDPGGKHVQLSLVAMLVFESYILGDKDLLNKGELLQEYGL